MHTTDSLLPLHAWPEKVQPSDPVSPRAGALSFLLFAVLIAFAFAMSGCHTLSDAERKLIGTLSVGGQADLRDWKSMTPAQQEAAMRSQVGGAVAFDRSQNGVEPSPEWRAILDAPTAPKATADAVTPR